jgi:hypothetical protein
MDYLSPLARHRGVHSTLVCEASPTRTAERSLQMGRCHDVTDTVCSTDGIIPRPNASPIGSIDNLGFLSPRTAVCVSPDPSVAPAAYPTGDSLDH